MKKWEKHIEVNPEINKEDFYACLNYISPS